MGGGVKGDCCPGLPLGGDPQGAHTDDCPLYLANSERMERLNGGAVGNSPCGDANGDYPATGGEA